MLKAYDQVNGSDEPPDCSSFEKYALISRRSAATRPDFDVARELVEGETLETPLLPSFSLNSLLCSATKVTEVPIYTPTVSPHYERTTLQVYEK